MGVKIRLRRTGRKKQPSYRIVVAEESTPRDGQYLDSVGTYNPLTKPADLRIDLDKVEAWLAKGAGMTDTAASLIRKARRGGDAKVAVRPVQADAKAATPDVAAVAEPRRQAAAPGSRGVPSAEAAADNAAPARPEAPADNAAPAQADAPAETPVGTDAAE
jgi:small subunit ribosomal protein S16